MSDNNRGFFADEYEETPRKVIKFISEEEAGVFDVIPQQAKRPDALPEPQKYVPQDAEQWNPGKKKGKRLKPIDFKALIPPPRLIFTCLAVGIIVVLGWVFYTLFTVVLGSGL